jgi:uncharacterized protein
MKSTLAEFQGAFLRAILAEDGFSAAAIRAQFTDASAHRLAVYADGYVARVDESLGEVYPAVARVVGNEAFHRLVHAYARAHQPASWDLGRAGEQFPGYVAALPDLAELPFLGDLARLEWALHAAFFTQRGEASLARPATPEALAAWRPRFSPAMAVVTSPWPVVDLWELREKPDAEVNLQVKDRPQAALVYQDVEHGVRLARLSPAQARIHAALSAGGTFGEALEAAGEVTEVEVGSLTSLWSTAGLVVSGEGKTGGGNKRI